MFNNKTYDILKYIGLIALPAVSFFVKTVGDGVQWQYTDVAVLVINASATLLGSLLVVSTNKYNKSEE